MPVTLRGLGNCEEELPEKPVGRQSTDRFFGELFFTITGV